MLQMEMKCLGSVLKSLYQRKTFLSNPKSSYIQANILFSPKYHSVETRFVSLRVYLRTRGTHVHTPYIYAYVILNKLVLS